MALVRIRLVALSGIMICDVCANVVSFCRDAGQIEGISALKCPTCGGSLELVESMYHPVVECEVVK